MAELARHLGVEASVRRLSVNRRTALDVEKACRALDRPDWLGPRVQGEGPPGFTRYLSDLAFPLATESRTLLFRKAAYIDLGRPRPSDRGCDFEIGWRSATLAPLFPVFAGYLRITDRGLELDGTYAPPLGEVGLVIDRAALHFVARRTGEWFLDQLAAQLGSGTS